MSNFIDALKASLKAGDGSSVTVSVRISQDENDVLQNIAAHVGTSRQEVVHQLIKLHAIPAWQELQASGQEKNSLISERKSEYFILNTNKTNSKSDHELMINEGIAAAFEDGYIGKINRIKKGDVVFLYESGKGIIACGIATGEFIDEEEPEKYGHKSMRYQYLKNFRRLSSPVSAKEVKRIVGRSIPFVQTLASISDGDILYQNLKKH
ncbi:hypothetical protein GEM49_01350 [Salmonella enterica]|uniref:EVE domain-containing protein n=1 Tax=Salmonella enterica TaxID=28901 RepID=A0A3J8TFA3_SALER|nr:hypothetical protein [Salmonella enterica]EAU5128017.1 hypothetical protein [Salmonella enterica subsp. enterica serovar Oranienburg]EBH8098160.1 hypothetical protein [Salmonella enterica subsp. houtenae serovar O:11:g,z25:-]ECJ5920794.1 hypothetical protein [Salmonella enterica subsp. houtenae]EDT6510508.1 hypothetical protein [Salmonella enterica subsp. enterica serovar Tallahassee]HAE4737033.1 hypothetical protein [Salmonella enterica subsp. houtenae serovar 41:z4,z23:-]HCM1865278.1 hyp